MKVDMSFKMLYPVLYRDRINGKEKWLEGYAIDILPGHSDSEFELVDRIVILDRETGSHTARELAEVKINLLRLKSLGFAL